MLHLMVFPSLGNHLTREYVLMNVSHIGRGFGMIAYRKRLKRSLRKTSKEVVMRTWLLFVRQRRENERVLVRRVIIMEDHHNKGRRRT
jgi:hypothetical protein